ncbi:MAG: hypothetical protein DRJ46_03805 [Thermoprotei archaeon]|nr:hypothetical protein [Thermoproteales archaeon]RLE90504.1 MAG: hypothetical protein DRJ46_03805 [Thermoprotei archaeon]
MDVKCTPICPFRAFYCLKKALRIRRGRDGRLIAWCEWVNDECIGYKCQYASCTRRALLPDGTCRLLTKRKAKRAPSIEEEAAQLEAEYRKLRGKLRKISYDLERLE